MGEYFQEIDQIIAKDRKESGRIIAIGECGLDYDRFKFADKETQHIAFPYHFDLAGKYDLPMYLHSRAT